MPHYRKLYVKTVDSLDVNDMPDDFTRLMWVLLPLGLCREGRGIDHAAWIKARLFPLRLDVTLPMIQSALDWYAARGMIRRYQVAGRPYFYVPTWRRYQGDTSREGRTNFPPPPDDACPEPAPGDEAEGEELPAHELLTSNSRPTHELVMSQSDPMCKNYSCTDADTDTNTEAEREPEASANAAADARGPGAAAPPGSPGLLPHPERSVLRSPTFQGWLERIQQSGNRPAVLREMFTQLYPGHDPPTHGRLGKFAAKVGGAARLAELMWKCSVRPPTGDVLAYLYSIHRHNGAALAYRDERDVQDWDAVIHR